MKTAMQELIEELNILERDGLIQIYKSLVGNDMLENIISFLLDKEKEQIMNAYCDGAKGGANGTKGQHEFGWVSRHTRNKYYKQTYNQNK